MPLKEVTLFRQLIFLIWTTWLTLLLQLVQLATSRVLALPFAPQFYAFLRLHLIHSEYWPRTLLLRV